MGNEWLNGFTIGISILPAIIVYGFGLNCSIKYISKGNQDEK